MRHGRTSRIRAIRPSRRRLTPAKSAVDARSIAKSSTI
ncbi:hypothetical protein E1H18_4278 [Caulobacter sp. RHG1]|nr:hypothetical protein [Caulobacter sp. RHG1]